MMIFIFSKWFQSWQDLVPFLILKGVLDTIEYSVAVSSLPVVYSALFGPFCLIIFASHLGECEAKCCLSRFTLTTVGSPELERVVPLPLLCGISAKFCITVDLRPAAPLAQGMHAHNASDE